MEPHSPSLDLPSRSISPSGQQRQRAIAACSRNSSRPQREGDEGCRSAGILSAFAAFTDSLSRDPARLLERSSMPGTPTSRSGRPRPASVRRQAERRGDAQGRPSLQERRLEKNPSSITSSRLTRHARAAGPGRRGRRTRREDAKKLEFYTRQYIDAISPTNFALTNPQVLHATVETGGRNLLDRPEELLTDIDPRTASSRRAWSIRAPSNSAETSRSTGQGRVSERTDAAPAVQPSTEQVYRRPLLIIPPGSTSSISSICSRVIPSSSGRSIKA